jgi:HAD superfamily hydrolase (TIGR01509 family)
MLKVILWDNDGLLVDTEELYFSVTREVLSEVGIDLTLEMFIEISLTRGQSAFDLAFDQGFDQETIFKLRGDRNRRYKERLMDGVRLLDGVEETLSELHGKVIMGIVTGSRREHFDVIHKNSGLLHYFDFIITREDYRRAKPAPDPFITALRRKQIEREHCLIVEDSERGLAAAKAAGIRCIVVPNPLTQFGNFSGSYRIFKSIREVGVEVLKLHRPLS